MDLWAIISYFCAGVTSSVKLLSSLAGFGTSTVIAAVKTDFNSFFVLVAFLIMSICLLVALVLLYRILANAFVEIIRIIANGGVSRTTVIMASVFLLILAFMSQWAINILLLLLRSSVTGTLYIGGHMIGAIQFFGEITGANQLAIPN